MKTFKKGNEIVGIDNLNSYYDVNLKILDYKNFNNYHFYKKNIEDERYRTNI